MSGQLSDRTKHFVTSLTFMLRHFFWMAIAEMDFEVFSVLKLESTINAVVLRPQMHIQNVDLLTVQGMEDFATKLARKLGLRMLL